MRAPSLNVKLGGLKLARRSSPQLVGLDIQPGYAAAVQAHVNGSVLVEHAVGMELPGDALRDGEVLDEGMLSDALRELFRSSRLDKRVRIGVANQRTVLRVLELPPITDRKELEAAVRFQAADEMPMPLENAVLDFHSLGVMDTPAGPRQRVAVVAAQRDMIQRLLRAARNAGLRPEGIDLSAFALIRSLYTPAEDGSEPRVLYLNVGGITNLAIAEGAACRFTRVISGGLESIGAAAAATHSIPISEVREMLTAVDLAPQSVPEAAPESNGRPDLRPALERGLHELAGEVRNSLEFHRLQGGGGEVSAVVLSGPAIGITGFSEALEGELGVPVRPQSVGLLSDDAADHVPPERLAVAAGLAVEEAPR
jgi:type IV pilus assembly protein PilM